MDQNCKIVVVGSCNIDFVCYTPKLPKEGETVHGTKFKNNFGGKGANQCVAAALLGGKTAIIAKVGNDFWGEKYIENLKEKSVNTTLIQKTENSFTGVAQIAVSDCGQNQIIIVAGANSELSENDVELSASLINLAEVVICQLETSVEVAIKALTLCRKISILNASPSVKNCDKKLFTLPSIFCVNEVEIEDFTDIKVYSLDDAKTAVQKLLEKGCKSVILTLGSEGAVYGTKNEIHHIETPEVKVVDTTGAGDAFIGALAYALAHKKEMNILEAIKFSCFAASDSVTRPGTQPSFPNANIFEKYKKIL